MLLLKLLLVHLLECQPSLSIWTLHLLVEHVWLLTKHILLLSQILVEHLLLLERVKRHLLRKHLLVVSNRAGVGGSRKTTCIGLVGIGRHRGLRSFSLLLFLDSLFKLSKLIDLLLDLVTHTNLSSMFPLRCSCLLCQIILDKCSLPGSPLPFG